MQNQPPRDETRADHVEVGRVRRAHGVRGELAVEVSSHNPERFAVGAELELVPVRGPRRRVRVAARRPHAGLLLVRLDGIDDRDAAEAMRGAALEVPRGAAPPPPEGSYYYFDLVGCRCADRTAGELGEVEEVIEDGGGLLLAVSRERGGRLLVPFVAAFIRRIALDERRIELDLPPGLLEACESTS